MKDTQEKEKQRSIPVSSPPGYYCRTQGTLMQDNTLIFKIFHQVRLGIFFSQP